MPTFMPSYRLHIGLPTAYNTEYIGTYLFALSYAT